MKAARHRSGFDGRRVWLGLTVALAAVLGPMGDTRAQTRCALSLVMAIDVSSSVDRRDYRLQMDGLAAAFRDETIR